MFKEQSYNTSEVVTPLIDSKRDLGELKSTIEKGNPDKEIEDLKKKYPNSARILEQLRSKRENQFSQTFMQGIEGQLWEEELICLLAHKNPLFAIPLFANYQNKSYSQKVLGMAMESAFHESPGIALAYLSLYKDKEHAEKMIHTLFETDKGELILFYGLALSGQASSDPIVVSKSNNDIKEATQRPLDIKNFLGSFFSYFNNREITIGKKTLKLQFPKNLNLFAGLLKTLDQSPKQQKNNIDWQSIQKSYEENMRIYIAKGAEMAEVEPKHNHVFLIRSSKDGGHDYKQTFEYYNQTTRDYYHSLTNDENFVDYSSDLNPIVPSKIIKHIQKTINKNPNDHIYIHLGLHGRPDGSAPYLGGKNVNRGYEGGGRTKKDFNALLNLKAYYPDHIHIDLQSCYSGDKDDNYLDNKLLNITRSSGKQSSDAIRSYIFLKAFTQIDPSDHSGTLFEADYDGDGRVNYHEAMMYVVENYNQSLNPTTFDYNGQAIDISMQEKQETLPTS